MRILMRKMKMNEIVTAIELNASGIRLVSGYVYEGKVYVLQSLVGKSISLDNNGLMDSRQVEDTLASLIETAKNTLKCDLKNYIFLLPPDDFLVKNSSSSSVTMNELIAQKDFANCISMLEKLVKVSNSTIVFDAPVYFATENGEQLTTFPLNVQSENLSVNADVHMISKVSYDYYMEIIRKLGILPYATLVSTYGSCSFLTSLKSPDSFYLIQVEGESTYLSLIKNKRLAFSKEYPVSMKSLYEKTAEKLNMTKEQIEDYITTFGLKAEQAIPILTEEKKPLEDIVDAFLHEFTQFAFIKEKMDELEPTRSLSIIFLGSADRIDGMNANLSNYFARALLLFYPKVLGARNDSLVSCLGGIKLTSNSYMPPLKENNEMNSNLNNTGFARG